MTLFTVGILVYNGALYLRETLDSVFAQTYGDFELLVINDGSTDSTAEILASYNDARMRVLTQENMGIQKTLRRMVDETRTPWLVRLDADDIAYPDRLAKTAAAIKAHPEAHMFYSFADYYQNGIRFGSFRTTQNTPEELRAITRSGYMLSLCHSTVAMRTDTLREIGSYRLLPYTEDIDLWARFTFDHNAVLIPEKLVGMRINNESISSNNLFEQAVRAHYVQYMLLSRIWNRSPKDYADVREAIATLVSKRDLSAKAQIRQIAIAVANKNFIAAACFAMLAFLTSPLFFLRRALLEVRAPNKPVINGVDPTRFKAIEDALWDTGKK